MHINEHMRGRRVAKADMYCTTRKHIFGHTHTLFIGLTAYNDKEHVQFFI